MNARQNQVERWIRDACVVEVSAEKPGNVTPTRSFADASFDDFAVSAAAIAPVLARTSESGVGTTILQAVRATRRAVGHNTNLGIILLLTPMAAVPPDQELRSELERVLAGLTVEDAVLAYDAINEAAPAGLGSSQQQDLTLRPTADLRTCMALAANHDLIARQYANGYADVLDVFVPLLLSTADWPGEHQHWRLGWLAVNLLAEFGDSLILRKCGRQTDHTVRELASRLLATGWPCESDDNLRYNELDNFLRDADHRRNPGTTADLIAATVFAALHQNVCRVSSDDRLLFQGTGK